MRYIDKIKNKFGSNPWFNRVEKGIKNRQFIIFSNYYPYIDDTKVYSYAESNKIKIMIIPIGV